MAKGNVSNAPNLKLQFPISKVTVLASRYSYPESDEPVIAIGLAAQKRGYFTLAELRTVCAWKTPRSKPLVRRNAAADVEAITGVTLSTRSEPLRIWTSMALDGVSWATSSVLLHLAHPDPYPIFDYRAMESLGITQPKVPTISFWLAYVEEFRRLLERTGVDKRTLDRALWQWSNEQRKD